MKPLYWWCVAAAGLIVLVVGLVAAHGSAGYQIRLLGVVLLILGFLFAGAFPWLDRRRADRS